MIYVEPTTPGRPVTALLMVPMAEDEQGDVFALATRVSYSNDSGAWLHEDGTPVAPELGQAITDHAISLGCTLA